MNRVVSRIRAGLSRVFSPRSFAALALAPALMATAGHYTVHRGDTLRTIAQRYCGSAGDWSALASASGISDGNDIYVGERVTLSCRAGEKRVVTLDSSGGGSDPSGDLSRAQVGRLWLSAGGPAWAEWDAEQISYCESGWNTRAYNPSGASGLWQILGQVSPGWIFDARVNARNAVVKFDRAGHSFSPWVCRA